jgi:tetratricopeptide (TPR) repeat protein
VSERGFSSHGFGMRARRASWWSLVGWIACMAAVTSSERAHAQETQAAESSEYTHTIEQAVEQFRAREFDRARELFQAAHKLQPSARTLRGVGLTDFESGRYAIAIAELTASLKETRKPLDAQQRIEIQAVIAHASGFVGTLEVSVTPKEATLSVDGVPVSGESLQLDAGDHALRASAPGYVDAEQQVRVLPADLTRAVLALAPVAASASDPVATRSDSTQQTAAWIVGSIGVAGVIVGSIFGVRSILKHNESDRYCGKDGCIDPRGVSAMDAARSAGDVSTVAFVAGGLALGVGTVLLLTSPSNDENDTERSQSAIRLRIAPGVVHLSGAF